MADAASMADGLRPEQLPVKVAVVDLEAPPAAIDTAHPGGGHYRSLLVLVRSGGRPRRLALVPAGAPCLDGTALRAALGAAPDPAGPAAGRGEPAALPAATVVVCSTLEREDALRLCLASLEALDHPAYDIVLVDNRREGVEPAPAWLAEHGRVRVVRERTPGLSAARNRGLAEAAREIVAYTDDDVIADRGWLRAICARFARRPDETCVTGLVLPRDIETGAQALFEQYTGGFGPRELAARSHRLRARTALFERATIVQTDDEGATVREFSLYAHGGIGIGASMAFRASALRTLGGFDVALGAGTPARAGEDIELFARLLWRGQAIGFEPGAVALHFHRHDEAGLRRQIEAYGTGFVACALALIADDPRHLAANLATAPLAVCRLGGSFAQRLRTGHDRSAGGPSSTTAVSTLARDELRGMLRGPRAYLESRARARSAR